MPKLEYQTGMRFSDRKLAMVEKVNLLITEYSKLEYSLTLRQVYYQFVARDWLPAEWTDPKTGSVNNQRSYQKLGIVISDGRLAGLIDMTAIEDRTRNIDGNSHWNSPADIIRSAARSFKLDKWVGQKHRVELWVEKDALEGIVGRVAREMDIKFFSCRGYTSLTSIWEAGQRLKRYAVAGQRPVILHLGDLDPSGVDMSRDIEERVMLFMDKTAYRKMLTFKRIALNEDQISQYNPPPNPAKTTDCRFAKFAERYGEESWELDALDPTAVDALIRENVRQFVNQEMFDAVEVEESEHRELLTGTSKYWNDEVGDSVSVSNHVRHLLAVESGEDDSNEDASDYE